jgi:hypothetical protein
MTPFDYLSVLFSVIVGLAITQLLQSFRSLMLARSRVRPYWPASIWPALMVFLVAQAWWGMFAMRRFAEWNFAMYGAVVLQSVLIYLTAGLAITDVPTDGPVDLRASYFTHRPWFFGLLALTITSTLLKDFVTTGLVSPSWNTWYLVIFLALFLVAAVTKSGWYNWLLAPVSAVVIVAYTVLLSWRL